MVLKERGIQVQGYGVALEVRGLEDTFLVGVTGRNAIRQELTQRTRNCQVVVVAEGRAIDLVLPVGVGIAKQRINNA